VPQYVAELAAAHGREWQHLYSNWNAETALSAFRRELPGDAIPITLVLHDASEGLIGSVSLVRDDLPGREDLNPWLASLYVMPQFRGRGHGSRLVEEALRLFQSLGYDRVHLFTETAMPWFARFGFVVVDRALANNNPVTIMARV